jgi:hypothetical protein
MSATFHDFTTSVDKYKAAFNQAKTIASRAHSSANSLSTMKRSSPAYKDATKAFKRFWSTNTPRAVAANLLILKRAFIVTKLRINYDAGDMGSKAYIFEEDGADQPGGAFTPDMYFCPPLISGYASLGTNSAAGTIVHEMSHLVLGTDDHIYGMKSCSDSLTAARQITNADNYKYYCELFQLARLSLMPALSDSYDKDSTPPR